MTIDLERLEENDRQWLLDRAQSRGLSPDVEALDLLDEAIRERRRREMLFRQADENRIRIPGPPLTAEEVNKELLPLLKELGKS